MINCDVVRDLLPLYVDGLASGESAALVESHVASCADCRAQLERMRAPLGEESAEAADYKKALVKQKRHTRKRIALFAALALALGVGACLLILLGKGVFHIAERAASPNGDITATVYSCTWDQSLIFPKADGFTLRAAYGDKTRGYYLSSYHDALFKGMWWSPSGRYLLLAFQWADGLHLQLEDYHHNHTANLDPIFNVAADAEYTFIHWREDDAMLIQYAYTGEDGAQHMGYFWFSCESWSVSGLVELGEGDEFTVTYN